MKKNLLLTSLMVSVMGFSSLFAEEVEVKAPVSLSCDKCDNLEEEEVPLLLEEETEKSQLSCDCDKRLQIALV